MAKVWTHWQDSQHRSVHYEVGSQTAGIYGYQGASSESDGEEVLFAEREKVLVQDGGVRWNSIYAVLTRALQLRSTVERFQRIDAASSDDDTDGTYSPQLDRITSDDWEIVRQYLAVLYPFVEATRALEGNG